MLVEKGNSFEGNEKQDLPKDKGICSTKIE
jgi:hypothetical protein